MSGSGGRRSGARCFLRLPGRRTSVLFAVMLDLSSVFIFGKSPAIRQEPALHASGAQAHQPEAAGITGRSMPCSTMQHFCNISGRKEVRGDKKGKIRVFLFPVETGSGPEGKKTSRHFHKVAAERRAVPLPHWLQKQHVTCHSCNVLAFQQPSRARDEGTFWQLATLNALESFQDWEPRNWELPGLGTEELQ